MDERDNRRRALDSQNPTALIGVDGQARIASLPDDRIIFTSPAKFNAIIRDELRSKRFKFCAARMPTDESGSRRRRFASMP